MQWRRTTKVETNNSLFVHRQRLYAQAASTIDTNSAVDEVINGLDQVRWSIRGEAAKYQVSKRGGVLWFEGCSSVASSRGTTS
jgi:hypothetical protein